MILFERNDWLVTADMSEEGDLRIVSGNNLAEWHATVRAHSIDSLQVALAKHLQEADIAEMEMGITKMLARVYGNRATNPFEEIKVMLDTNGIKWKSDFWGDA